MIRWVESKHYVPPTVGSHQLSQNLVRSSQGSRDIMVRNMVYICLFRLSLGLLEDEIIEG